MSKDTKLIFENWDNYQRMQRLDEGLWSDFKGVLAKLGNMDDLVSVFSKKKRMERAAAEEYIEKLFAKESNKFAQAFKQELDSDPDMKGFPNMKDKFAFLNGLVALESAYESIVAATEIPADKEGHIPIAMANEMIQDLKDIVEFYDKKLADVYAHFDEQQVQALSHLYLMYETEFNGTSHKFSEWLNEDPVSRFELVQDVLLTEQDAEEEFFAQGDEQDADSLRSQSGFREKGASGGLRKMKGLKKKGLPLILMALGTTFTVAHLVAAAAGFGKAALLQTAAEKAGEDVVQTATGKGVEIIASEHGLLKSIAAATDTKIAGTMGEFSKQLGEIASTTKADVGEITAEISKIMPSGANGAKMMEMMHAYGEKFPSTSTWDIVNNTKPSDEFIEFVRGTDPEFADMIEGGPSGAGTFKGGLTNVLGISKGAAAIAGKTVVVGVAKAVPKVAAGFAVGKMTAGTALAGSGALKAMGIAGLAAGAAVLLARWKGQKSSRAQKLEDLDNKMVLLQNPEIGEEPSPEDPESPEDPSGGVDPQPEDPAQGADGEDETPPQQRSRLMLVRLNDDGIKFHPGRNSRSDKQRGIDRTIMKKAQDQGITGADTDPDQGTLRNRFGTKGVSTKVKDTSMSNVIQIAKKKIAPRSKRDAEPYITVGDEIYKDLAIAFKDAGLVKTARITNKVKAAVRGTVDAILAQMVKKTPPKKLTWKQVQPTLIKQLRTNGLGKTSKNSKAVYTILRTLQEYGLVRGEIPEDPVETPVDDDKPDNFDANMFEGKRKPLKEWRKLARLFKD